MHWPCWPRPLPSGAFHREAVHGRPIARHQDTRRSAQFLVFSSFRLFVFSSPLPLPPFRPRFTLSLAASPRYVTRRKRRQNRCAVATKPVPPPPPPPPPACLLPAPAAYRARCARRAVAGSCLRFGHRALLFCIAAGLVTPPPRTMHASGPTSLGASSVFAFPPSPAKTPRRLHAPIGLLLVLGRRRR